MASYKVRFRRSAEKDLRSLPKPYIAAVTSAISKLAGNPRPIGSIKLSGAEAHRIRVGPYRVVYEIEDDVLVVIVIQIGHRKDVYR